MASLHPYTIVYYSIVAKHFRSIDRKYHSLIRKEVDTQLGHLPEVVTRNRKPLRDQPGPRRIWELRCGPNNRFRIIYELYPEKREVHIVAVGVKEGSRLFVGGEEMKA
ncbi:MAG: addiction module toxin RelE [Chloroflexi bacterium]|nr:addiction module toxin RelE [Chloroflexota bacterium]